MQSFLQYRQFRRKVQEQWKRDVLKAETLRRANVQSATSSSSTSTAKDQPDQGVSESHGGHRPSSIEIPPEVNLSPSSEPGNPIEGERPLEADGESKRAPSLEREQEAIGAIGMNPSDEYIERPLETENEEELSSIGSHLRAAQTAKSEDSFGVTMGTILTGVEVRQISALRSRRSHLSRTRSRTRPDAQQEEETVFVVGFDGPDDPMNPQNWSMMRRSVATLLITAIGVIVGFASSADSMSVSTAAEEFHVSEVVEAMATGLFLLGLGLGALYAGPISETVGRNPVYVGTMFLFMIFIMGAGLAPNITVQLIFRFLAGFCASTPMSCAGGSISDMWSQTERIYAFPLFANGGFFGPILGPIVGGFIEQSSLSWRWSEWVTLITSGCILLGVVLFQPETYPPILLKFKAHHLRTITKDERFVAEVEIRADRLPKRLLLALYRPFVLLVQEPIIIAFALYITVVYIVLFTFLDGYIYIFTDTYGLSPGMTGLCFAGIGVGLCLATMLVPWVAHRAKRDLRRLEEEDEKRQIEEYRTTGEARCDGTGVDEEATMAMPKPPHPSKIRLRPEERLWYAMLSAPAVPISIFWMGWTANSNISYWSPLVASVFFGYGVLCIFISTYQYLIDSYELYAASALAAVSVIRYAASGGMSEVGIPFYQNMGINWTLTILGALSAIMVPVPYVLYIYGPKIRSWSKYTA